MAISPLGAAAIGLQVAGGISSALGAKKAAKKAEELAEEQAQFTFSSRMEELRKMQNTVRQEEGMAVATAYASGVQNTGTTRKYLAAQKQEYQRQLSFKLLSAYQEKRLIEKGGKSPGLTQSLIGTAASTLASAAGTYKTFETT